MPSRPGAAAERDWLAGRPPLEELRDAYPEQWDHVQREIASLTRSGDLEALKARVLALAAPLPAASRQQRRAGGEAVTLEAEARRQMLSAALRQASLSVASGKTEGRVRFNLLNGWIAQRLLFERGLKRKPVSLGWFRLLWPLLWQRGMLMPLVGPKGIYCFYSRRLIAELAELIGSRPCLEIAAGDGTLTRFLRDAGVDATATDDRSWSHAIDFPEYVQAMDAVAALRTHRPLVVIAAWPPAGNAFEREVFRTPSVETYIVIGSRHRFASGNWEDYERQSAFVIEEDPRLAAMVLPPEVEATVLVMTRDRPSG